MKSKNKYHLIIIGFDEIVGNKYINLVFDEIDTGQIQSWTIVDLNSEAEFIKSRLSEVREPPEDVILLNDLQKDDIHYCRNIIGEIVRKNREKNTSCRAYIATEVRYHFQYALILAQLGVECLIEKPVLAPVVNERYCPELITEEFQALCETVSHNKAHQSVMTLSRYHDIYNNVYLKQIADRVEKYQQPVTSLHLHAFGGVWNRSIEYRMRDDHPYKYGYRMMMHGAYHYLDLAAQILQLNATLFNPGDLVVEISCFSARPLDQSLRFSKSISTRIDDVEYEDSYADPYFGEVDIVAAFSLRHKPSDKIITIGSLSFEQSSPSLRNWADFLPGVYNKNGRNSSVYINIQLGPIFGSSISVFDVPDETKKSLDIIDAYARVDCTANAFLLDDEVFLKKQEFHGLFHNNSNKKLMRRWLQRREDRSLLHSHRLTMELTKAMSLGQDIAQTIEVPLAYD